MAPFWNKKWGKDAVCAITHVRLRPGKNRFGVPYTITLPCKHRYYRSALVQWVKSSPQQTCPMCRKKIYLIDLITFKN